MGSNRISSSTLCPPLIGVDSSAAGGLYNIARQRASHEFPVHSTDDLEVIGMRRLTGRPAEEPNQTPNTSGDFEWDFGEEISTVTRRLDHLVNHRFGSLDRRRRMMESSEPVKNTLSKTAAVEGSRSVDEVDAACPSLSLPVSVDVIDGSSIGPRFGHRTLRHLSSSSSNHSNNSSSNYNETNFGTLLPNQTTPTIPISVFWTRKWPSTPGWLTTCPCPRSSPRRRRRIGTKRRSIRLYRVANSKLPPRKLPHRRYQHYRR